MAFFGLTRLGDERLFATASARHQGSAASSSFHDVPLEAYLRAFQAVARDNGTPGASEIRRALIPRVFSDALRRPPTLFEMDVALRFFDVGPGNITIKEFGDRMCHLLSCSESHRTRQCAAIDARSNNKESYGLKKSGHTETNQKRTSYNQLHEDRDRHIPNDSGPCDNQDVSLTTNQEYGWEDSLKLEIQLHKKDNFPKNRTDVTLNEGICMDNYYKMF
ncbi:hypothetical protein KP509_17G066700 [Ceratopteris richardii]|uniref:Uncharacterized protein n=1 Tax=Ceratopteris richardii TaxID=49495 RepID=A0A8T2SV13_CERRI|nr:hypothetical protein KP509_17G066700 [Ceratopteris richardii]